MLYNRILTAFLPLLITLFSATISFAQSPDFKKEWASVDSFISKGLPQSALKEVDKIYAASKKNQNQSQLIKSLLFQIQLTKTNEENATAKGINSIQKEINETTTPVKNILQSVLAGMYWNYYENNRWKILSRTTTTDVKKNDFETWSPDDFYKKVSSLYLNSLENKSSLQKIQLAPFDAIIKKGNARELRPTLYDLLAHRALDYFKNEERNITRPNYYFQIKDSTAFASINQFINHRFTTKDTASLHYKALTMYQDLLEFHQNDKNKNALLDANLGRLNFVYAYSVHPDKDRLYLDALKTFYQNYPQYEAGVMAGFLRAQVMYNLASESTDSTYQYSIVEAKNIAQEIFEKYPKTNGGIFAENLLNTIKESDFSMTSEKVNEVNKPFRTLVKFKNVEQIFLRIVPATAALKSEMDSKVFFQKLIAGKNLRSWTQTLPYVSDYKNHSTEIKIDALPPGEYFLVSSNGKEFDVNKNVVSAQFFYVSNISFVHHKDDYFVLDRTTGFPLIGAKIKVSTTKYDYDLRKYKTQYLATLTSNKNGFFRLPPSPQKEYNRKYQLDITYQNDFLNLDEDQYFYYSNSGNKKYTSQKESDKENARIFLFMDRSIYRPGQVVYFKGIGVTKDAANQKSILLQSNDSLTVYLKDANYQKADSMRVWLNDYGSFSGQFRLPENKLNGQFAIQIPDINNTHKYFSVEEYKRPKFFAEIEKPKGSYRVNDTVKVTGFAKAYAGNNINDATVSYKVTRNARFLYPWIFWRWGFPSSPSMEITHGTTTTDANGQFEIQFTAIPDLKLNKSTLPVFDYTVEVDITDINGETRSTTLTVPVGYQSLNLQIKLPENGVINKDNLSNFSITSQNLSGEPENTTAQIKVYKLIAPNRLIRARMWEAPDLFVMSKNEFLQYFPHDEYRNETRKETWDKGNLVLNQSENISKEASIILPKSAMEAGWYVIEANAKDKYGEEVKDIKYFQVYDSKNPLSGYPDYFVSRTNANEFEPGDTIKVTVASSADSVFLISQKTKPISDSVSKNNFEYTLLNKKEHIFQFPVTDENRGGFGFNEFFVKDNRFYSRNNLFAIPWTNKELQISFDTYREKTLPGSKEKWTIKISGKKGEKVAAEMLVSMYDASLDQFKPHNWQRLNLWPTFYNADSWTGNVNFSQVNSTENYIAYPTRKPKEIVYDELNYLPNEYPYFYSSKRRVTSLVGSQGSMEMKEFDGMVDSTVQVQFTPPSIVKDEEVLPSPSDDFEVSIRKNFNETAFFYPHLKTDSLGNVTFEFTMPEALTQWKLMALAHTKDLASGYVEKTVITQKELMVQPNAPRFVREGDKMEFSAKVVNMSDKEMNGTATLHILNASTLLPVDAWFKNVNPNQTFSIPPGQSKSVHFSIEIPTGFNEALVYRIVAKSEDKSDGEEAYIPVVTNKMLVTETLPLPMRGEGSKTFKFEKLFRSGSSKTLSNFGLTVEYTSNPAWLAIQALPYLSEVKYECADLIFNRFYANAIASKIVQSSPKIKAIFEKWRTLDTAALMSNLQKNEELKSVLLEETPWVLQAKSESQQKKNIALLFDAVKMNADLQNALKKLKTFQTSNGGFTWFANGPDDRGTTQTMVAGLGHLQNLGAIPSSFSSEINAIIKSAINYLDNRAKDDYDRILKNKQKLNDDHLSSTIIQYLYARSFFKTFSVNEKNKTAFNYYREQSKKYWLNRNKLLQAMIALSLHRQGDASTPKEIIRSLKENAIQNEELGMYWKEWNHSGYWWYEAPIESQSVMIEAFSTIDGNQKTIDDLKTWLLKNKQTNRWKSSRATADAVYALLLQGTDWLSEEKNVEIKLGDYTINSKDEKEETGTGYFKRKIDGNNVQPEMGNIRVTVKSTSASTTPNPQSSPSWGAVYWQYFENLDKITFSETPLKLSKQLFIEKNTDAGPVLYPIKENTILKMGDKIKVRIELRVDRNMEYVHMKDMRAAGLEPINVLSGYKWQGGLGYYETTKDVSTNFFFSRLNKGTYVFEYPVFVSQTGDFSNGITTIQSMYAPEFTAHSEGVRITVKP